MKNDLDEIKSDLKEGIYKVIENTERIEKLDNQADNLKKNAHLFRSDTREIRNESRMCSTRVRMVFLVIAILVFLAVAYVIAAFVRCSTINLFC